MTENTPSSRLIGYARVSTTGQALDAQLEAGDVVVVTRIDRLARSTFDLFSIVKQIADAGA